MAVCDNFRGRHRPYHKECNATPALHNGFFMGGVASVLRQRGGPCGQPLRAALDLAKMELARNTTTSTTFHPLPQLPEIHASDEGAARAARLRHNSHDRPSREIMS